MIIQDQDEKSIKKMVARRAKELGTRISHREVMLDFMNGEVAPGCRVFRASWGAGETEGGLTGLIKDKEAPDTYPAQALGKVFHRWLETEGKLPDPAFVAKISAFFYDASRIHEAILTEKDQAMFIKRPEWLPHVQLPKKIEVAGQPGVIFWWTGPTGISQMRVYLDTKGRIQTEEIFIQDILERK